MRWLLVSEHLPEREGTATGRILRATVDGLLAEEQDVSVVSWTDRMPAEELPPWARHAPVHRGHSLLDHLTAIAKPRGASAALGLEPDEGTLHVAEEPLSYAAIATMRRRAVVVHFSSLLDARALGRVRPHDVQGHRADRRAVRGAHVVMPYSARVADAVGSRATPIPAAVDVPAGTLEIREEPRALLLAGWDWAPNRAALQELLACWDEVRAACPGAELVLAGRGAPDVPGARVLGEVPRARDAFAEASVLAFPCPASSGPKTKVLEAMAAGLPVVTTPAGVEGLTPSTAAAAAVTGLEGFPALLAEVLADPARRVVMAAAGRAAVIRDHGPRPAARARISALSGLALDRE
jgi:hypothetical protein